MSKETLVNRILTALRTEFADEADIALIDDDPSESTIGMEIDGEVWFLEIQPG
jgi:hypothetical protein